MVIHHGVPIVAVQLTEKGGEAIITLFSIEGEAGFLFSSAMDDL